LFDIKRKGDFENADKYLLKYEQLYDPHPRAYGAIIRQKVILNNDLNSAMFYWSQLRSKCSPSILAYASIIAACSKARDFKKAEELYDNCISEFGKESVTADYEISATMIVVYGKLRKQEKMTRLYESCIKSYAFLAPKAQSLLITALSTGHNHLGNWKMVLNIWESNYRHRISGGKTMHSQQEMRLLQQNDSSAFDLPDSKEPFIRVLDFRSVYNFGVNPALFCIVLDALGNARQLSAVHGIWKEVVVEANFPIVLNNITSYIEALCLCNEWEAALQAALEISEKYGFRIDEKTARNLLLRVPSLNVKQYCYNKLVEEYPYLLKYPKLNPKLS
jgi:pentatricopeptide repeat protein